MPAVPPPLVLSMILCEAAHRDSSTGKWSLLSIFNVIHLSQFPGTFPPMVLYMGLTEIRGDYSLRIQIVNANEESEPISITTGNLSCPDPLMVFEAVTVLRNVLFPKPGEYRLQVWVRDELIGSLKLRLLPARNGPPKS